MRRLLLCLVLGFGFIVATPAVSTHAYGPFSTIDCSRAPNSAVCRDRTSQDPLSGNLGLLLRITNIIAYIAGAAAIIMILIAAFKFITANGDSNAISSARGTIISALIGLAVIVLARTIINFVVLRL